MSAQTTYEEYLNEQLINCLNLQTNVIQNLAQHSQFLSLQLIDIKSNVEILTNRIVTLQQQSYFLPPSAPHVQIPPNPFPFSQSGFQIHPSVAAKSTPFSFAPTVNEQPSRHDPFVFQTLSSSVTQQRDEQVEDKPESDIKAFHSDRLVELSPVEVRTDENILFCERARLYRFDASANEMKERGVGELKILQHRTTHLCRVLMRRERVLNVCANHEITAQMELNSYKGSTKAYVWSAMDYADGDAKHEILCVRFKTDEQAKHFVQIFNDVKASQPTKERIVSSDDDEVIFIGELKPTPEQIKRASKFQLPKTFYLYESKEPCPGCRGCLDDSQVVSPLDSSSVTLESLLNFPSAFFPNSFLSSIVAKTPPLLDTSSSSPPKEYRMIIKAKRSLPSNRLPPPSSQPEQTISSKEQVDDATTAAVDKTHQKKLRNFFAQNNTPPVSLDKYASEMADNVLDRVKNELCKLSIEIVTDSDKPSISANSATSIFGSLVPLNPANSSAGFSFTSFGNAVSPKTTFQFARTTPASSSNFLFGNTPKISFADLVKQTSDNHSATNQNETRVFPGQGSLLFSSSNTEETDDSYEPMKSFKPIVHLLPVEVKTGEEDENILFCERAKLYRFDAPTNQMKERGIGEMKILQHKTTHHFRVLMRREQVFKVCANHKITPQLELKEHTTKENAFIWSVMDYADGLGKPETLCVRFKTNDQAKRFCQQFNNAKLQQ